jgi:hypothetical protein
MFSNKSLRKAHATSHVIYVTFFQLVFLEVLMLIDTRDHFEDDFGLFISR